MALLMRLSAVMKRRLLALPFLLLCLFGFVMLFAAVLTAIVTFSLGVVSVPMSMGMMIGLLGNVVSDLAPPAIFFLGLFCLFWTSAMIAAIVTAFRPLIRRLQRAIDWFRIYE